MRPAALLLAAVACAHPTAPAPRDDAPAPPHQPTRLEVRDSRAQAPGAQLKDTLTARAAALLQQAGVPVAAEAALLLQVDVLAISTTWGLGTPRSCVKLLGRVVRDGQAFAAAELPIERCTSDERYAAFKDVEALATLSDPKRAPTPESQLIAEAFDPLVNQLAQRCR